VPVGGGGLLSGVAAAVKRCGLARRGGSSSRRARHRWAPRARRVSRCGCPRRPALPTAS
jgi:hypothetical protein